MRTDGFFLELMGWGHECGPSNVSFETLCQSHH
jgi:hypothetical protein